jgi:molybdate transport system substrate-binding protein
VNLRRTTSALTGLVALVSLAQPAVANAAEVTMLCSNGIRAAMEELLPQFEQATGHAVAIRYGLSAVLKREIEAGEPFDLAVLTPPLVDDLIEQGRIAGDSRVTIGRSAMALAVRAGAARPDIRTAEALKRALLASTSIIYAKEGASSAFFIELVRRLDLAEALASRIMLTTTGAEVGAAVARGEAELGVLPISEILPVPGIEVLGTFPAGVQGYVVMVAGASPRAARDATVKALIAFLISPSALPVIRKRGMERG